MRIALSSSDILLPSTDLDSQRSLRHPTWTGRFTPRHKYQKPMDTPMQLRHLLCFFFVATGYAHAADLPQAVVDATVIAHAANGTLPKSIVPGCTSGTLPTTPVGPTSQMTVDDSFLGISHARFTATVWRKACADSRSQLLVTLSPNAPTHQVPLLFTAKQGSTSYNVTLVDAGGRAWSGALSGKVTLIPTTLTTSRGQFDPNAAFEFGYIGLSQEGEAAVAVQAAGSSVTPPPPQGAMTDAQDGAWYNPTMVGQGFFIDVDVEQQIVALGWYTAHPQSGAREWYTALGTISGLASRMSLLRTTGVQFATPGTTDSQPIGTVDLAFASCTAGTVTYDFEGNRGTIPISRLTSLSGQCQIP